MIPPLLYIWGDDDLVASRIVERFEHALGAELGMPLERWDVRADPATAASVVAQLEERLATPVLFGGGTLAVVATPGALVRRNDTRERVVRAMELIADGNAVVFVEATKSNAKGPGPRRLAEAVTAAGGRVVAAQAPRPTALAAWIEREATGTRSPAGAGNRSRARGSSRGPGDGRRRGSSLPQPSHLGRTGQARPPARHRWCAGDRGRRSRPGRRIDTGIRLGPDRRRRRAAQRGRPGCPGSAPGNDAGARAPGRPPPPHRRAARAGRPSGRRGGPARRCASDGHQERVPGEDARLPGSPLDHERTDRGA